MGFKKVVKKGILSGWDLRQWAGLSEIKGSSRLVKDLAVNVFKNSPPPSSSAVPLKETFAQCIRRLGLTEADLQKRIRSSQQILLFCLGLAVPTALYMLYLIMAGKYLSSFVCLMLTLLLLAYSFREHFNIFQMRQRRLGCTFQQWYRHLLNPKSSRKA